MTEEPLGKWLERAYLGSQSCLTCSLISAGGGRCWQRIRTTDYTDARARMIFPLVLGRIQFADYKKHPLKRVYIGIRFVNMQNANSDVIKKRKPRLPTGLLYDCFV